MPEARDRDGLGRAGRGTWTPGRGMGGALEDEGGGKGCRDLLGGSEAATGRRGPSAPRRRMNPRARAGTPLLPSSQGEPKVWQGGQRGKKSAPLVPPISGNGANEARK